MKVHTKESKTLQAQEEKIAQQARDIERELFRLIHKLDTEGYSSKNDQIVDAITVGKLAKKYDRLSSQRMEVFEKMMEAMETK